MGCCGTGLQEPKNNVGDSNTHKNGSSTKTIVAWVVGIVLVFGLIFVLASSM